MNVANRDAAATTTTYIMYKMCHLSAYIYVPTAFIRIKNNCPNFQPLELISPKFNYRGRFNHFVLWQIAISSRPAVLPLTLDEQRPQIAKHRISLWPHNVVNQTRVDFYFLACVMRCDDDVMLTRPCQPVSQPAHQRSNTFGQARRISWPGAKR